MKQKLCSKMKPDTEKTELKVNRFRFESYIDKLAQIELKIGENEVWESDFEQLEDKWYSVDNVERDVEEDSNTEILIERVKSELTKTAFGDSLNYWEGRVRYCEFVELVKILKPYKYTLVHILQKLEYIVQELTQRINECEYPETAEAISFLLSSLAKDTRLELLPMLPIIIESLSKRLEKPFKESSLTSQGGIGFYNERVIQSIFSCTSTMFFYLSNYILKDLRCYLDIYRRWIYHNNSTIRYFSAESIAYAMKKGKNEDTINSINSLFIFARDEYNSNNNFKNILNVWLCNLLSNTIFSTNGFISKQGELIINYVFRYMYFGLKININDPIYNMKKNEMDEGFISNYLSIINQEDISEENFDVNYDTKFRESFSDLELILKELLTEINSRITENTNYGSFQHVLILLLYIYIEIFNSLVLKEDLEIHYNFSSLIFIIQLISNWISNDSNQFLNTESMAYKKRLFKYKFSHLTLQIMLIPLQRCELFSSLISQISKIQNEYSELILQVIETYIGMISSVAKESIFFKDPKFIDVVTDNDDLLLKDSNSSFKTLIFFFENYKNLTISKWKWFLIILDSCKKLKTLRDKCISTVSILEKVRDFIPLFETKSVEFNQFIEIIVARQENLVNEIIEHEVNDLIINIPVISNILSYIDYDIFLNIKAHYENNLDFVSKILIVCHKTLCYKEINFQDLHIILNLIIKFYSGSTVVRFLDLEQTNKILTKLLEVYENFFGTVFEDRNIEFVYKNLDSIKVFKSFCIIFNIFKIRKMSLEKMTAMILYWSNLSENLRAMNSKCAISRVSNIPLEYNIELISIISVLFKDFVDNRIEPINNSIVTNLKTLFLYWIVNPLYEVRKKAIELIYEFFNNDSSGCSSKSSTDLLQGIELVMDLESCEANIETERNKIRIIHKICDFIYHYLKIEFEDDFLINLLVKSVISQLYVKLSLIWNPCIDAITKLTKTIQINEQEQKRNSNYILRIILSTSFNMIYFITYQASFKNEKNENLLYTDKSTVIEYSCKLLSQINFSEKFYAELSYYQNLLLYWILQTSFELEGNQDYFFRLKNEDKIIDYNKTYNLISDLNYKKGQISIINSFLIVLESVCSNISNCDKDTIFNFLFEKFVDECIPSLLHINHIELQLRLIRILCKYGRYSNCLMNYKVMFEGLISGSTKEGQIQSFRNILLLYPLSMEREDIIKRNDRDKVIPIVIRILLSKLNKDREGSNKSNTKISKKGNKSLTSVNKRKMIISYLSELPNEEITLLLSIVIDPLVNVRISNQSSANEIQNEINSSFNSTFCEKLKGYLFNNYNSVNEIEGYNKNYFLDFFIKRDNIFEVKKYWNWREFNYNEGCHYDISLNNEFGFVYSSDKFMLRTETSDIIQIKISLKQINIQDLQYKSIIRFLSYIDNLLNNMSHTLKNHIHIILIILVNILYLNNNLLSKINKFEFSENSAITELIEVCEFGLDSNMDHENEELSAKSSFGNQNKKFLSNRLKIISKLIFTSISNILTKYHEFSEHWEYLLKPISPILLDHFEVNLRGSGKIQISSIMGFMMKLSQEETLFTLYSSLFPHVLYNLSIFISDKYLLSNISKIGINSRNNSETIISTVIEMFLYLLFGGQEMFLIFVENNKNYRSYDYFQENNLEIADKNCDLDNNEKKIKISNKGLNVISNCIPNILNSLEKIIYTRYFNRINNKIDIITWNELTLLKIIALMKLDTKNSLNIELEFTNDNLNVIKIILLLLISCIDKLNSKNERIIQNNISVFNLVMNLLKSMDIKTVIHQDNAKNEIERNFFENDKYNKDHLLERMSSLLHDKDQENLHYVEFCKNFIILISEMMSYLLLKASDLKLRSIISEIFLFAELQITNQEEKFHLILSLFSEFGNNNEENKTFTLKRIFEDLYNSQSSIANNINTLISVSIFGLNRPSKKRSLEFTVDIDLQLEIMQELQNSLFFNEKILISSKDIELIYPLVSQLLFLVKNGEDFSIMNFSSKFIKKIILSWCCLISTLLNNSVESETLKIIQSIYNLLLNVVVPFEEEILKYSRDLSIKRIILQLIETKVEHFSPLLELFCNKFEVCKNVLISKFHLSLHSIIEYDTIDNGEKVRLFEELVHIQKHKRARALNFLGRFSRFCFENTNSDYKEEKELKDKKEILYLNKYPIFSSISSYTVKIIGIQLAIDAILQRNSSKDAYNLSLGDNSLRSIESFTLYLDWKECIDLTANLIRLLKFYPQRKTYIIKSICSLLNSFDFQVNEIVFSKIHLNEFAEKENISNELEQQLSEMQMSIKTKLLPLLGSIMIDRSYKINSSDSTNQLLDQGDNRKDPNRNSYQIGLIRSDIVLIIIRVLRCLPSKQFHSELPRLLTQLVVALKSKDREIRRSSRFSLKSICKTLGVKYLPWIFFRMSNLLTTGYQSPVLIFTTYSILHELTQNDKEVILDDCIEIINNMIIDELNRIADPDRRTTSLDTIDTPITGSVDEGKYIRSPQIIRILSKNASIDGINRIFEFLEDLLTGKKGERNDSSVVSDSFSQKYLHWLKILLQQFCIGLINNENVCLKSKLRFSIVNLAKSILLDKNMIINNDLRNLIFSIDQNILSLFQDPMNLVESYKKEGKVSIITNSKPRAERINGKEKLYMIQPGASTGRGTHQVLKYETGFEKKIRSVVLSNSLLYLMNNLLKNISSNKLLLLFQNNDDENLLSIKVIFDNLLPLLNITFSDNSSELASISCKCIMRLLIIDSMQIVKDNDILKIDYYGPLISKTALNIMERSGINSINTSNNIVELISSTIKLFVALLMRPNSSNWLNKLFFENSFKKITPFYSNVLKQLHIMINDNRLRITSLQLLRQIILYGKDQITVSSECLGSLYSLVDSVLPLIVQYSNVEPKIVTLGCNLYVEFLLYYPMSNRSQRQRISILLENLTEYPTSEGREALLTAIYTLVTRFPFKLMVDSYNIMFLCGLTLSLSTETETRPRSMIKVIIFEILGMYKNDFQQRVKLINIVFGTLRGVENNVNVKCGLIILLQCIIDFFYQRKEVISKKHINKLEILILTELKQVLSILSEDSGDEKVISTTHRLEYEVYNLIDLLINDDEVFELIISEWFKKGKAENRKIWKLFWTLLLFIENGKGLNSNHLWIKASAFKVITNLLNKCLKMISLEKDIKSNFIIEFVLNEYIFTHLFNKIIPFQFEPILEESPWLAPKILACIQHLILLSDYLKKSWVPPKRLSELNIERILVKFKDDSDEKIIPFNSKNSFYDKEKKSYFKKIKISKENEVKESDWLIYEEENGTDLCESPNDDTEETIDTYLMSQIPEEHLIDEENEDKSTINIFSSNLIEYCISVNPNTNRNFTLRKEVYWWLMDRISCCCRYYATKPGTFRVRLMFSIRSLYEIIVFLPILVNKGVDLTNSEVTKILKHAIKALYQCSTMLKKQEIMEDNYSHDLLSFDWIKDIADLGIYQVIIQVCLFAQKTVEKWDYIFNEIDQTDLFMKFLSEVRKEVLTNRINRKSRIKLDIVKNPEIALKRKQSSRIRNKKNRKRKLKSKLQKKKLV